MSDEVNKDDPFDGISLGELQYATLYMKRYRAFLENLQVASQDEKETKKYTFLVKFLTMVIDKNDKDIERFGKLWHQTPDGEQKFLTEYLDTDEEEG